MGSLRSQHFHETAIVILKTMACNIVICSVIQGEIEGKWLCGDWTCQELGLACEADKLYDFRKV